MSPIYLLTHVRVLTQLVIFTHDTNLYYWYWMCIYVHATLPLPPLELVLTPFIPQINTVQIHMPIHLHWSSIHHSYCHCSCPDPIMANTSTSNPCSPTITSAQMMIGQKKLSWQVPAAVAVPAAAAGLQKRSTTSTTKTKKNPKPS